jgi:hypothetical protein
MRRGLLDIALTFWNPFCVPQCNFGFTVALLAISFFGARRSYVYRTIYPNTNVYIRHYLRAQQTDTLKYDYSRSRHINHTFYPFVVACHILQALIGADMEQKIHDGCPIVMFE